MTIHIMKIYNESFHDVRSHKREWLKVAYGPLLLWAVGALLLIVAYVSGGYALEMHKVFLGGGALMLGEHFQQATSISTPFLVFAHVIYSITYFVSMIALYINGYRYAILHEGGDGKIIINFNMRFIKMVLYGLLIGILVSVYTLISGGIILGAHLLFSSVGVDIILGILLTIYGFYLLFRMVLYPVAISIDQSEALRTSWHLMKGNVLRLIGLFLLVILTIGLIGLIGSIVLGLITVLLALGGPVLAALSLILWVPFGIFMVLLGWAVNSKVMALVYQELAGKKAS